MTIRFVRLLATLAVATVGIYGCSKDKSTKPPDPNACLDEDGEPLPVAPPEARVDLEEPSFSNPTQITNPLFPISDLARVIQLGTVDGLPFRAETTLLADAKTIVVNGRSIVTLVSQYFALLDGRIHEVALDWYAQADDGSVWYFGEDVFNYEDGVLADTEGTWQAGRDGPFAMIMPHDPEVGDVWRPENICGFVFEEVTAKNIGVTVDGPRGPVPGALRVEELHMDGFLEDKIFAPGYGEFSTGSGGDLEAVALAVPTDELPGPVPTQLETVSGGALEVFGLAQSEDWKVASSLVAEMTAAWNGYRAGTVPPILEAQMNDALESLADEVDLQSIEEARQAAIEVAQASLDFQLGYAPRAEIDIAMLDLWACQVLVDAGAADQGALFGDVTSLEWIRDRVVRDLASSDLDAINGHLTSLRAAASAADMSAAAEAATELRATLAELP